MRDPVQIGEAVGLEAEDLVFAIFIASAALAAATAVNLQASPATLLAKRLRGEAGLLAKKAGEVRGIREG